MISTRLNAFQHSSSTPLNAIQHIASTEFNAENFITGAIRPNQPPLPFNPPSMR
jgi:hypothetical protein